MNVFILNAANKPQAVALGSKEMNEAANVYTTEEEAKAAQREYCAHDTVLYNLSTGAVACADCGVPTDELVLAPRGLLGAAAYAIEKGKPGPNVVARLRERATGASAQPAEAMTKDLSACAAMASMLEEREWAEHANAGPVSARLETAITKLHNELSKANEATKPLRFPTMLRKMWSGGEVQQWLDEQAARPVDTKTPDHNQGEPVGEVVDMKYNRVHFYRVTGDENSPHPYLLPGTKLYTSANAEVGEVERLRREVDQLKGGGQLLVQDRNDLRAKVVERDAMLRGWLNMSPSNFMSMIEGTKALLSASAEPENKA